MRFEIWIPTVINTLSGLAAILLEALREMIAAVELEGADSHRFFEARNNALGAIAKAEGKL